MLTFTLGILLLAVAVIAALLKKAYFVVPTRELKRQAAAGNELADELYRAVGFGRSLRALLWLKIVGATTLGLLLIAQSVPLIVSFILIFAMIWIIFIWLPSTRLSSASMQLTRTLTPAIARVLHTLDPLLQKTYRVATKHYVAPHSGLYELRDMLNLLDLQAGQTDSRITAEEIQLMRRVLEFGDRHVRDVMQPRSAVKTIAADDSVGPVLLDEIHASGHSNMLVTKTARSKEFVGAVVAGDLKLRSSGLVADHMIPGVLYVHENDSLADALHAFYETRMRVFVVVDNHQDYIGALFLEDILTSLLPKQSTPMIADLDATTVVERHRSPSPDGEPEA